MLCENQNPVSFSSFWKRKQVCVPILLVRNWVSCDCALANRTQADRMWAPSQSGPWRASSSLFPCCGDRGSHMFWCCQCGWRTPHQSMSHSLSVDCGLSVDSVDSTEISGDFSACTAWPSLSWPQISPNILTCWRNLDSLKGFITWVVPFLESIPLFLVL